MEGQRHNQTVFLSLAFPYKKKKVKERKVETSAFEGESPVFSLLTCTIPRFYSFKKKKKIIYVHHVISCGMLPLLGFPQHNEEEEETGQTEVLLLASQAPLITARPNWPSGENYYSRRAVFGKETARTNSLTS